MFIKNIKLLGFRNYLEADLFFDKKKTIIIGKNAQGKTNLLEVIQILSQGKSRRAIRDAELVNFNLSEAFIHAAIEPDLTIALGLRSSGRRTVKVNDVTKKPKEFLHHIYSVSFMADDLEIVQGSPSMRRDWIDAVITQLELNYNERCIKLKEVLSQRNSFLKKLNSIGVFRSEELKPEQLAQLEVWDEVLIEAANYISAKRTEYLFKLQPIAQAYYQEIANSDLALDFHYDGKEINKLDLLQSRTKDLIRAVTHVGPHRDEIDFLLGGRLAKTFASQGERRTITLALKLAELVVLKEVHGGSPILLLDDVLAELDESRQDYLLDAIDDETQVIITTTHLGSHIEKWSNNAQILEVENGVIKQHAIN